jgi:hypothetical protein
MCALAGVSAPRASGQGRRRLGRERLVWVRRFPQQTNDPFLWEGRLRYAVCRETESISPPSAERALGVPWRL